MKSLKLSAVVKLLKLMHGRRRATIFLIEHLIEILEAICPRIGKKSLPWIKDEKSCLSLHGDITTISSAVEELLPILWRTFSMTVSYFRDQLNSSAVITTETDVTYWFFIPKICIYCMYEMFQIVEQLTNLFRLCLITLEHLFSWTHVSSMPSDSDALATRKKCRREKMMEIIEHCILHENEKNAGSEAEITVSEFLVDICEVAPSVGVAIAILDCFSVMRSSSSELSNKMDKLPNPAILPHFLSARHTLAFLKKEWVDQEGKSIKGATLNLAVPHDEKRKSKVYEQNSYDPDLNERDTNQIFACFTRYIFD
ncbi:hypothetical protein DICVIV_04629 [Dictyocaulus viviparus]|uniref:Uncharacterized protein n=1 Tax=Dictyocaulus viviparus TaxID=29172 RepID=A0A0D8XZS4_DICVI|nr:hypothetical protein DICVIV_04629 [Dictyocaulus viviparus]